MSLRTLECDLLRKAPFPLLPNYGAGVVRAHYQDFNMMFLVNGKERSFVGVLELGTVTNLKFEKLWDMGEAHVLEFSPDKFPAE
ncbi:hypothetical protein C8J56DRAFT_1044830 [Mycena floridula]|nr:hypothetical protein C8J56DRAFT_1044830 [Mycena floridula]